VRMYLAHAWGGTQFFTCISPIHHVRVDSHEAQVSVRHMPFRPLGVQEKGIPNAGKQAARIRYLSETPNCVLPPIAAVLVKGTNEAFNFYAMLSRTSEFSKPLGSSGRSIRKPHKFHTASKVGSHTVTSAQDHLSNHYAPNPSTACQPLIYFWQHSE
jgi:hypothetical protein